MMRGSIPCAVVFFFASALLLASGCTRKPTQGNDEPIVSEASAAAMSGETLWRAACARAAAVGDELFEERLRADGGSAEGRERLRKMHERDQERAQAKCREWLREGGTTHGDRLARCLIAAKGGDDLIACDTLLSEDEKFDAVGGLELTVKLAPEAWRCPGGVEDLAGTARVILSRVSGRVVQHTELDPETLRVRVLRLRDDASGRLLLKRLLQPGCLAFRAVADAPTPETESMPDPSAGVGGAKLHLEPDLLLDGTDIQRAIPLQGARGHWRVHIEFTPTGARKLADATAALTNRRIALVLDGVVLTAPVVSEPVTGGRLVLSLGTSASSDVQKREAMDLARSIGGGSAHPPLIEVSRRFVVPASEREVR